MSDDFISDPDVAAHTGFILAEEAALKYHVSGLQVPNPRAPGELSEVPVWFRWPESERRMAYPFITIDLLNILPAYERWTSLWNVADLPSRFAGIGDNPDREGVYYPGYTPDVEMDPDKGYYIERYLPYDLLFQVSTFARSAFHDRFLTSRFITDIFPPRHFGIDVPADHVLRRCELVQWATMDTMETGEAAKRIFRKVYTVRMETEIPVSKIYELEKVGAVHVDIYDKTQGTLREGASHPVDSSHTVAAAHFTTTGEG